MNVYRVKLYIDIEAADKEDAFYRIESALYGSGIPPYCFLGDAENMGPTVREEKRENSGK